MERTKAGYVPPLFVIEVKPFAGDEGRAALVK
jgi:hypothetical protein